MSPGAGTTIPLSGAVISIQFSARNMDPNKGLKFMPELVRNGEVLGRPFSVGFVLNLHEDIITVGTKAGHYLAD